jgi:hypothetical protein
MDQENIERKLCHECCEKWERIGKIMINFNMKEKIKSMKQAK